MADWPGNPICQMIVRNTNPLSGGGVFLPVGIKLTEGVAKQQTVSALDITFTAAIEYHDDAWFDHGRGYFSVHLNRLTPNGWQLVTMQETTLGDKSSGDWYDTLSISVTIADPIEQYQLLLHAETREVTFDAERWDEAPAFQAIQGKSVVGNFTLDFVPLTIVYCPPGQDMTNSLTQTESFGTRFTIGETSEMQFDQNLQLKLDALGIVAGGVGSSSSQSMSNQSVSSIQVSHFRNTIVTADNQKAIGRAYWGPLNDIFVILVKPSFAVSRRADGTMFSSMQEIQQV